MYKLKSKKTKNILQKRGASEEKGKGNLTQPVQSKIDQQKGTGRPLPNTLQADMEARSGVSLDSVNIHTGPAANEMADELGAKAFTTGNDIFFNSGYYAPETSSGQSLIEHELNHVLQQRSGEARGANSSQSHYDAMEAKADQPIEQHAKSYSGHSSDAVTQREDMEEEEVQMAEEEEELQAKLIQREDVEEEELQMAEEEEELQAKLIQREEIEEEEVQMAEEEEELQAKLIQREDEAESETPYGLSLGVEPLTLDISMFENIPQESNLDPQRLFELSPEFKAQLVNEWRNQYLLLHSGPAPVGNEWDQIWAAWRRLADEHIASGEGGVVNPLEALEAIRQPAADEIIAQIQGSDQDSEIDFGAIAENVGRAFERALNATQFYPRLRENIDAALEEHRPLLATAIGSALATSSALGATDNNWAPTSEIAGLILGEVNSQLSQIELPDRWQLSLSVNDFEIENGDSGPIFNLTPQAVFRYQTDHVSVDFGAHIGLTIDGSSFNIVENGGGSVMLNFSL